MPLPWMTPLIRVASSDKQSPTLVWCVRILKKCSSKISLCWVVFVINWTFVVAWVVTRIGHVFGTSLWYLSENQRRQAVQRSTGMAYPFHGVPLRGHGSACRTSSIRLPVVSHLGEIANHTGRRYSTDRPTASCRLRRHDVVGMTPILRDATRLRPTFDWDVRPFDFMRVSPRRKWNSRCRNGPQQCVPTERISACVPLLHVTINYLTEREQQFSYSRETNRCKHAVDLRVLKIGCLGLYEAYIILNSYLPLSCFKHVGLFTEFTRSYWNRNRSLHIKYPLTFTRGHVIQVTLEIYIFISPFR